MQIRTKKIIFQYTDGARQEICQYKNFIIESVVKLHEAGNNDTTNQYTVSTVRKKLIFVFFCGFCQEVRDILVSLFAKTNHFFTIRKQ